MGIRTVCVLGAVLAPSPWRWLLVVGALGLPYIAVVMANAGRERERRRGHAGHPAHGDEAGAGSRRRDARVGAQRCRPTYPACMSSYGFLRQPRWLALGFLVLLVVPSFFLLSRWQLSRLDDRRYLNDLVHDPRPRRRRSRSTDVMTAGAPPDSVGDAQRGSRSRPRVATTRSREVLVRKRPLEGANGFWVVDAAGDGRRRRARGEPGLDRGVRRRQRPSRRFPPRRTGEVTVVGRVQPSELAPRRSPATCPPARSPTSTSALVAGATGRDGLPGLRRARQLGPGPGRGAAAAPPPRPLRRPAPVLRRAVGLLRDRRGHRVRPAGPSRARLRRHRDPDDSVPPTGVRDPLP